MKLWHLRLFFGVIIWFLYLLCFIPLVLLGWALVPLAAVLKAYTVNPQGLYHFTWPFMKPWDNPEDGIANNSYSGYTNMFMRICSWYNRNPVNGLRSMTGTLFSCDIKPQWISFVGSFVNSGASVRPIDLVWAYDSPSNLCPQWFVAFQDLYATWYWIFKFRGKLYRIIIGYNIYPTFVFGVTPAYANGSGFSITFKSIS